MGNDKPLVRKNELIPVSYNVCLQALGLAYSRLPLKERKNKNALLSESSLYYTIKYLLSIAYICFIVDFYIFCLENMVEYSWVLQLIRGGKAHDFNRGMKALDSKYLIKGSDINPSSGK